jgi:hypothetical protein
MKAPRSSKTIREAIEADYHQTPDLWAIYHALKWLGEAIDANQAEVCTLFTGSVSPPPDGENTHTRLIRAIMPLGGRQVSLERLESCLRAVTASPDLEAAKERYTPLYRELSAALAAEGEEIAALTAKAEELSRQREKAQAAADAEIAKASKPVSAVISALTGIADRLRELRS